MYTRCQRLVVWIASFAFVLIALGCRSAGTAEGGRAIAGPDASSLLLTEVAARSVALDVLTFVQPNVIPPNAIQIEWSEAVPAIQLLQDRRDAARIILNPGFWREHERLIEATVFAAQFNVRQELRPFAIARAQQLRAAQPSTSLGDAETFWRALGFNVNAFLHVRERPEFQSRVRALRHQALIWLLARAAVRDLGRTAEVTEADIDRRAVEATFDLHGSPAPPLVTAFLTAAVESRDPQPSSSELLCRSADWIALGAQIIEANSSFQERLARSEGLQRTVATLLKGLAQLREEGQCPTPL